MNIGGLVLEILERAVGRIPTHELASIVGCEPWQIHGVIPGLRTEVSRNPWNTISNVRGEGYMITEDHALVLDEMGKSLSRLIAQCVRVIDQMNKTSEPPNDASENTLERRSRYQKFYELAKRISEMKNLIEPELLDETSNPNKEE